MLTIKQLWQYATAFDIPSGKWMSLRGFLFRVQNERYWSISSCYWQACFLYFRLSMKSVSSKLAYFTMWIITSGSINQIPCFHTHCMCILVVKTRNSSYWFGFLQNVLYNKERESLILSSSCYMQRTTQMKLFSIYHRTCSAFLNL